MRPGTRIVGIGLIALMAIGSVMLWLGIPIGWIWIGSKLQKSSQPTIGPYLAVGAGILFSMVAMGKTLAVLNRAYGRLMGSESPVHVQLPWLRSMRGEREVRTPPTVLDVVMVMSVAIAGLVLGIWFLFLAGSPLPR